MKPDWETSHAAALAGLMTRWRGQAVAVLGHLRPDGDCIGSQVALCRVLNASGVPAVAVNHHEVPRSLRSFVGDTPFLAGGALPSEPHLAVSVDCADPTRFGVPVAARFPRVELNIDHHLSNAVFAEQNWVFPESCATAEILARLFFAAGRPVDPVTAQALYVGIATDTGQFRYFASQSVFELCGRLVACGADPVAAGRELYERESPAKLQLLQHFLASLRFLCDGRVCVGVLDRAAWESTGARKEDTEGLVDYARGIEGVEIGVLLEDRPEGTKGSFRAKDGRHRVDLLARQLQGGGHPCAAGFNPHLSLADLHRALARVLENHFAALAEGRWPPPPPAVPPTHSTP